MHRLASLALAVLALFRSVAEPATDADLAGDRPSVSVAGLPPFAPDSPEKTLSELPVRDLAAMVMSYTAPVPFIDYAPQIPLRRPRHNLAALEMGNGRDAAWMTYAAAEAERAAAVLPSG